MFANLDSYIVPIRQSTCHTCHACIRKCMFRNRLGLVPNRRKFKSAAHLGTLVHRFQQVGLAAKDVAKVRQEVEKELEPCRQAIYSNDDLFGDAARTIKAAEDNFSLAWVMAELFAEAYPTTPALQSVVKEQEVEASITIHEGGETLPVWLAGRLDDLQQLSTDDSFWIRDFKSTSRDLDDILVGYQWGPQLRIYRILANAWLHQHGREFLQTRPRPMQPVGMVARIETRGFILNVLQRPGIILSGADRNFSVKQRVLKSGPRKGETVEDKTYYGEPLFNNYLNRVRDWYRAQVASGEMKQPFTSLMVPFTEPVMTDHFAQFLLGVRWVCTVRLGNASPADLARNFPKDPSGSACRAFEQTCDYYPLCCAEPDNWPSIITASFKQEKPDLCIKESEYDDHQPTRSGAAGNDSGRILVTGS